MSAFDLTLLSLYRINGQEWPQLPGLLAQNPPKRHARGRDQDHLIVYLTLAGNVMFSSSEYNQIIGQVSETFYSTAGSLTFALKSAVEALNTFLVERNMASTSQGQYSVGALVLGALRGNLLYLVQCGPTHVFSMGLDPHHYHDAQMAGKGLGLGQTTRMYFAQAQINPGDRILFCAALPPNWEKAITEERGPASLEVTRRRLMAANDGNISAVLIQFSAGAGAINLLKPAITAAPTPAPVAAPKPASPAPAAGGLPAAALPPKEQTLPPGAPAENLPAIIETPSTEAQPPAPPASSQSMQAAALGQELAPRPAPVRPPITIPPPQPKPEPEYSPEPKLLITPEQKERLREATRKTALFLAKSIGRGRDLWHNFRAGLERFIPRLLPAGDDGEPTALGRSWPVFVAVLVPILTIVMGVLVYQYLGIPQQVREYYTKADEFRQKALVEPDLQLQREYWKTVVEQLDVADQITPPTGPAQQLRQEAQTALDALNRVVRVEFKLAFPADMLSRNLQITHMTASDTDVYLLDAARGVVLRGVFNGQNYTLDTTFECGPGAFDGITVGGLIDIIALPRTNPSTATVLGVDAAGNLLYCIPGETPRASFLQPPDTGWNHITAVAYDANNLYVLDAPARAVWVYFGDVAVNFPSKPYYFFESQIPLTLETALGIAVNGDDLYLLYSDGHMTTCTLSRLSTAPTRCNDPAIFTDTRPGFTSGIRLADGNFTQIAFTTPPDPSVVLLRPHTQSVFRFSARALELQKELRALPGAQNPLLEGENITAMAFSPNKALFVFVGGELYVAVNVP